MLQRERAFALIIDGDASGFVRSKLRELDATVIDLEAKVATLRDAGRQLSIQAEAFSASQAEKIAELVQHVQSKTGDDAYALRSSLAARLRDLIKEIQVWNWGELTNSKGYAPADTRFFEVAFKDGSTRLVACSATGMTSTPSKSPERSEERPEKGLGGEFVGD